MADTWNNAVKTLKELTQKYISERTEEPKDAHKTLLLRALVLLKNAHPDTEIMFTPMAKTMVPYAKRPDKKGDREKGLGRHYYCAVNSSGRELKSAEGYYRNGMGKFAKSARTMLEEDYTMALTMYIAGFTEESAKLLGRAVHMVSDACCVPHASKMTYFSPKKRVHTAYEGLSDVIYPEFVPEQELDKIEPVFADRSSFRAPMNDIAAGTAKELDLLREEPFEEIRERLLYTERKVAALLLRFFEDASAPDEHGAIFVRDKAKVTLLEKTAPLSCKITEKGIRLHGVNPCPQSRLNVTGTPLYAAHRHDGLFTLAPAREREGMVIEPVKGVLKLRPFDPRRQAQLFEIK
ncbi:MAG: hypothetical protein II762_01490 [Ruminococcus sp.]|nr:hypothetical protein [Ruminococcus sp.]